MVEMSAGTLAVLIQGFVVLLSPSRHIPGESLRFCKVCFLQCPLQFIIYQSSNFSTVGTM